MERREQAALDEFVEVVRLLREKCPWDSTQTHESLKDSFRSETEETLEAIDLLARGGTGDALCEELGDVLLHIVLQSILAQEEGLFDLEDVIRGITAKMKFRHPRIFSPEDEGTARLSWDELKKLEKDLRAGQKAGSGTPGNQGKSLTTAGK